MSSLEEIEAKRAARKAASAAARAEQYLKDLSALNDAEEKHGDGRVASLETSYYAPGLPTLAVIKAPSENYYKRFCQQARKAGTNGEARGAAQDQLAEVCWIYPEDKEVRKAMLSEFPGLLLSVAIKAAALGELQSVEEGKG